MRLVSKIVGSGSPLRADIVVIGLAAVEFVAGVDGGLAIGVRFLALVQKDSEQFTKRGGLQDSW